MSSLVLSFLFEWIALGLEFSKLGVIGTLIKPRIPKDKEQGIRVGAYNYKPDKNMKERSSFPQTKQLENLL